MSLRTAINEKCRSCCYDPKCGGGTWREQVAQCSVKDCALWPYRPAPSSGRFADPPRNPLTVDPAWLAKPIGEAVSPPPWEELAESMPDEGVAA